MDGADRGSPTFHLFYRAAQAGRGLAVTEQDDGCHGRGSEKAFFSLSSTAKVLHAKSSGKNLLVTQLRSGDRGTYFQSRAKRRRRRAGPSTSQAPLRCSLPTVAGGRAVSELPRPPSTPWGPIHRVSDLAPCSLLVLAVVIFFVFLYLVGFFFFYI